MTKPDQRRAGGYENEPERRGGADACVGPVEPLPGRGLRHDQGDRQAPVGAVVRAHRSGGRNRSVAAVRPVVRTNRRRLRRRRDRAVGAIVRADGDWGRTALRGRRQDDRDGCRQRRDGEPANGLARVHVLLLFRRPSRSVVARTIGSAAQAAVRTLVRTR
jgi:hypothetical protein